jgi:hypothetical protein
MKTQQEIEQEKKFIFSSHSRCTLTLEFKEQMKGLIGNDNNIQKDFRRNEDDL